MRAQPPWSDIPVLLILASDGDESRPLAGNLFDFAYKSNLKNVRIYQESLRGGRGASVRQWAFFAALALALPVVVAVPVMVIVAVIHAM